MDMNSAANFAELTERYREWLSMQLTTTDVPHAPRLKPLIELVVRQVERLCPAVSAPMRIPHLGVRRICAPSMPWPEGFFVIAVSTEAALVARFSKWPVAESFGHAVTEPRLDALIWSAVSRFINAANLDGLMVMLNTRLGVDGVGNLLSSFKEIIGRGQTPCFVVCVNHSADRVVGLAMPLPLPPSVESHFRPPPSAPRLVTAPPDEMR